MTRKIFFFFVLTVFFLACSYFENKEKKAIEICQTAKVQLQTEDYLNQLLALSIHGLTADATWLDYANMLANEDPNEKHDWTAKKTEEDGVYLVAFEDKNGWGHRWEVTIDQQIVKMVSTNQYLSRKYGLSWFDHGGPFQITNFITDTIKLEKETSDYSENHSMKVVYVLQASIKNKTGKALIRANVSGKLQVIFKDKTIEGEGNWNSGFKTKISKSNPWKPDTERTFYIKTSGIDQIYLDYEPEYVFLIVTLKAEDPIGFSYNKGIEEYDLKTKWKKLKQ